MTIKIIVLATALALAGCATNGNHVPVVVDTKGVDMVQYELDFRECMDYANTQPDTASSAVGGALIGALLGAAFAQASGMRDYRSNAARFGALVGGLEGAGQSTQSRSTIVKNCLLGRGYKVLY